MPLFLRAGLMFGLNGFMLGSFLSRIPDILAAMEIDKATLGLALFAAPVGSVTAAPFVGRYVERYTAGRMGVISGLSLAVGLLLIALAPNVALLALALFVAGFVNGGNEVSVNAAANIVEKVTGAKIMSRGHGLWSFGFMTGAFLAGTLAQADVSYQLHLPLAGIAGALGFLVAARIAHPAMYLPEPAEEGREKAPPFALPNRTTIGVCLMAVGITLAEGAIYDWGTLYLRQDIGTTPFLAGVAYGSFTLSMAVCRMMGDSIRHRFSGPTIVRCCALLAGIGLIGFVAAPSAAFATPALMLMGAGVSLVFPVSVAAVARRGTGSAAANMAGLSLSVMTALLAAPPLIGLLGEAYGLAAALLATLPMVLMTGALAGEAAPRPRVGGLSSAEGSA